MNGMTRVFDLPDEAAQSALGARLGVRCRPPLRVYLRGALGAGKTTLVRGALRAMGWHGAVPSPSYTLVEPYDTPAGPACHVDLYRLADALELEDLGVREYLDGDWCCFVEWPEHGAALLAPADLDIIITPAGTGRRVSVTAHGQRGAAVLEDL